MTNPRPPSTPRRRDSDLRELTEDPITASFRRSWEQVRRAVLGDDAPVTMPRHALRDLFAERDRAVEARDRWRQRCLALVVVLVIACAAIVRLSVLVG